MMKRMFAGLLALVMLLTAWSALAERVGTVNVDGLVLRKAASTGSKALQTLDKGDRLTIRGERGDWYRVTYGKYGGYVMKQYVTTDGAQPTVAPAETTQTTQTTVTQPAATQNTAAQIAALGGAPAASRLGDSGEKVRTLQKALRILGYLDGSADGDFGPQTEQAVLAYQRQNGLSADGIAGEQTICRIFGEKPAVEAARATERLDWFGGGSNTIPRGAVVTVKDVKTGRTFQVRRWGGVYHMDSEPVSAEDTAAMKAAYGGTWSWNRRAILVKYKDHVYAASMNGMPHGNQSITTNGFGGHFCIHFYGSKTHCGNKVDPDHKACEAAAMQATW